MRIKKITFCIILCCLSNNLFSQQEKLNANVSIKPEQINNTKKTTLGRDQDPKKINDLSKVTISFRKIKWTMLSLFGPRFVANILYPKSTVSFIKTKSKVVAFTIDDGFCGLDNPDGCMVDQVRELFKKHQSKATFFIAGSHCKHVSKNEVELLLKDGHEIANHSMYDFPYNKYNSDDFESDFEKTNSILKNFSDETPLLYRSPFGRLSKKMNKIITQKGYKHIICDGFANDTAIPDPKWISKHILRTLKPGSIVLIHMPEVGVREWNYEAIKLTLEGLKRMNYNVVTVSELLKYDNR